MTSKLTPSPAISPRTRQHTWMADKYTTASGSPPSLTMTPYPSSVPNHRTVPLGTPSTPFKQSDVNSGLQVRALRFAQTGDIPPCERT